MSRAFADRRFGPSSPAAFAAVAVACLLPLGFAACGDRPADSADGKVTVFAAASLTEAFTTLGKVYEAEHEGSEVVFSFAASSELAAQIDAGAPADVFASADEPSMRKVADRQLAEGEPVNFASNVLEIATPKGNPGGVHSLSDLADEDLTVAICAPEVPCGTAAETLFEKTGIDGSPDTFEPDVKSVLTKVELDEVDAGLVYHSDVVAAGDRIDSIAIPDAGLAVNRYPIALLRESGNRTGGQQFIDLVLSETGRDELEKRGFRGP